MKTNKKNRNLKHLSDFAKSFTSSYKFKSDVRKNLLRSRDGIIMITNGACIRPDIFLDNDRTCDYCVYSEDCVCGIKKFSKYYKNEKNKQRVYL